MEFNGLDQGEAPPYLVFTKSEAYQGCIKSQINFNQLGWVDLLCHDCTKKEIFPGFTKETPKKLCP